ncbi:MAG: hypothetical protein LBQ55_08340, partial [Treponema sp.]|nr:hypothetical protein [Treponema sp.]
MGRYVTIFIVVVSALLLVGILAYTQLEIYPETEFVPYSRRARANEYLALERWLTGTGHPVRVVPQGNPDML